MAKIPTYPATTLTGQLQLVVNDLSDTTLDPSGRTKHSPLAGLVVRERINVIPDPGPGGYDFTVIPQSYDRLYVKGKVTSAAGGNYTEINMFFNGDTDPNNYFCQFAGGNNNTANNTEIDNRSIIGFLGGTGSAGVAGPGTIDFCIEAYTDSLAKMGICVQNGFRDTPWGMMGTCAVYHKSLTAPITQIQIQGEQGTLTGRLELIGERALV